jgi:hypothetical protein
MLSIFGKMVDIVDDQSLLVMECLLIEREIGFGGDYDLRE